MYSEKVFADIIIALIMAIALTILFVNENDMKMYSMGYEWVPTVQGHWEKNGWVPTVQGHWEKKNAEALNAEALK